MEFKTFESNFLEDLWNWLLSLDWMAILGYSIFVLMGVGIIVLVVTFFVWRHNDMKFIRSINYQTSGARAFKIDSVHNEVTYFDIQNLNEVKKCSMEHFFGSFPKEEQTKVSDWIDSHFSGKQTSDFIQTNVYINKQKKTVPSFLRITKAAPTNGIVHLESYILKDSAKRETIVLARYPKRLFWSFALMA